MAQKEGFCDLGFAKLDLNRKMRRGFPEVIYCCGKTVEHIKKISNGLIDKRQDLLLTKLEKKTFVYLKRSIPKLKYNALAKIGYYLHNPRISRRGLIAVICAGTADIPIAEEAAQTAEIMGNRVLKFYDVGVAGVHRLMHYIEEIRKSNVIIVVAGMEGALASLVSGLVAAPVIAVPTSCGYGANFSGLAALLTMLNGCSPGVAVVNIDNGFGAGYFASLISK
ncbi:MAG: nickel pincer cofactor biosynthesis protein LarB [Candidatus Omnitrophica bacterium]|nr:nickel pincer cofactor biosynthesis protein LarB [Candidatus Omnitrophota bacterium]